LNQPALEELNCIFISVIEHYNVLWRSQAFFDPACITIMTASHARFEALASGFLITAACALNVDIADLEVNAAAGSLEDQKLLPTLKSSALS
jgi:hypothetical protein